MRRQNPIAVLWERLGAAPPQEVAGRARVAWDPELAAYRVPLLADELRVFPADSRVEGPDGFPGYESMLVCVQYLLTAADEPPAGEMVNPLSLPYGDFFFRGRHELPTGRLEEAFGGDVDAFRAAAEALGGQPAEGGDAACDFQALPRVAIQVVLWRADDEFPARAQFLFDKAADRQLPIDALWVLAKVLAKALVARKDA